MGKVYNKLVRDKIPEIIAASGKIGICEELREEKFIKHLDNKLLEEVHEYLESGNIDELADISEVMRTILTIKNISPEELENVRLNKLETRGGFSKRIFLKEVIEN